LAESNKAVWAALASNAAIMISKFIGALAGGSSSLLAEALHSVADTGDSAMLLLGKRRAAKPPDPTHPFGHGKELYFWTLVVAVSIFTIGGVGSIIEGIEHIAKPPPIEDPTWTYIVLGLSALFEGASMIYAWHQFLGEKGKDATIWDGIKKAKDPTTFMVVFEDTAAVLGVFIAVTAVFLEHLLQIPWLDGLGALCVGVLMASVATFMIYEIRALLVGERAVPQQLDEIKKIIAAHHSVEAIHDHRTMHFGPDTVLLTIRAKFKNGLGNDDVALAIEQLHDQLQQNQKEIKYIFIEPARTPADESHHAMV
jgi:cation diffusion facilitator family transporter